jgi:amidophosphoribosyltransferase
VDHACHDKCGLMAAWGLPDASELVWLGLHALQHRGQESAGIVACDNGKIRSRKGMGLLPRAVPAERLRDLPGEMAIGHVRYSTTGASKTQNIQPLVIDYSEGLVAIAHNGNLTNARTLRAEYEAYGSIFQTSTDSEIIVHLMAKPSHVARRNNIGHCLNHVRGAYCFLFMRPDRIIAARDPKGFRPLALGRLDGGWVVASESVAFDLIGATFEREIEPGEMVTISREGVESEIFAPPSRIHPAHCIFEHIYFARPDSTIFGENVHTVRYRLGKALAEESMVPSDVVVAIPDSGYSSALGYCKASGLPLDRGLIRNHYVGRTFLAPLQAQRSRDVSLKHNVVPDVIRGRRVVLVDDSLIRGTTTTKLVRMLRRAGAKEIHLRISCPPNRFPCFYGIDFPTRTELIASENPVEEVERIVGVDSLRYLSLAGMLSAVKLPADHYCTACFTGRYPVPVEDALDDKYDLDRSRTCAEADEDNGEGDMDDATGDDRLDSPRMRLHAPLGEGNG